jgi:hypothetical protein
MKGVPDGLKPIRMEMYLLQDRVVFIFLTARGKNLAT